MPHSSHQPPAPEPPQKRAGSSDAARRHGLIRDHTVFHVVTSYRARPEIVAPSKRNCRIAQRIARTPKRARGAHTRSSCSRNITVWQVVSRHIQRRLNHRNLAGTPAQGASITSTTTRPWPCAIQPATRAPRQLVARLNIKHQNIWGASHAHQMEALQTDEQITPITPIKRHRAAAGRDRHRPRSLKTAGVEVRSSPGTSTSTRNPRSTPTHPHSTRKSQFDRGPGSARGRLRHVRARGAAPEDERIKRDGQGPARPGRPAPRTHAPRPRGARRGACAPRSRHPCVT